MNAEDTLLTQKGAALLVAYEHQDEQGQHLLLEDLDAEGRAPDAFILVAIVTADALSRATGLPFADVFNTLPEPGSAWPTEMVHRHAAARLAVAIYTNDDDAMARASADIADKGHAIVSGWDLAEAVLTLVPEALGISRVDWLKALAISAAAGARIDE